MRDYKFRGRGVNTGLWHYGYLCNEGRIREPNGVEWAVKPETVGQYTGLKDKNGVDIYEGDIVKWGKPPLEVQERIAVVKIDPDIQLDCRNIDHPYTFHWANFAYGQKDLTVIGNIYETPELLTA